VAKQFKKIAQEVAESQRLGLSFFSNRSVYICNEITEQKIHPDFHSLPR
jgi:hypothetical protein